MLLKYMFIYFFELQLIAHDVQTGFVNFFFSFVYTEFWLVNVDISLSLLSVFFICVDECLIYIGVNCSFCVLRQ